MPRSAQSPSSWWRHIPQEQQQQRARQIRMLRLRAWIGRRGNQMKVAITLYLLMCLVPIAFGLPLFSAFASLPLLLLPAVGYLSYYLIWQEFHR